MLTFFSFIWCYLLHVSVSLSTRTYSVKLLLDDNESNATFWFQIYGTYNIFTEAIPIDIFFTQSKEYDLTEYFTNITNVGNHKKIKITTFSGDGLEIEWIEIDGDRNNNPKALDLECCDIDCNVIEWEFNPYTVFEYNGYYQFGQCSITGSPVKTPTQIPTFVPTNQPSLIPSLNPSNSPSISPTYFPSFNPTKIPSINPSKTPTINPTNFPTFNPTMEPFNLTFNTTFIIINSTNIIFDDKKSNNFRMVILVGGVIFMLIVIFSLFVWCYKFSIFNNKTHKESDISTIVYSSQGLFDSRHNLQLSNHNSSINNSINSINSLNIKPPDIINNNIPNIPNSTDFDIKYKNDSDEELYDIPENDLKEGVSGDESTIENNKDNLSVTKNDIELAEIANRQSLQNTQND